MNSSSTNNGAQGIFELDVSNLMDPDSNKKFALLILNSPISLQFNKLLSLWKQASLRITIDGGTNRWFSTIEEHNNYLQNTKSNANDPKKLFSLVTSDLLPDIVSGDLDSINEHVLSYCKRYNVNIIETSDQNKTDFEKAIELVVKYDNQINSVVALCEFYGRFDQSMANINTLYKAYANVNTQKLNIFIMGENTLTWLLRPGTHKIYIPPDLWSQHSYCGIIPIGHPCYNVTTTGLKWNLSNSVLEFGYCVSTSNTYDISNNDRTVTISTDNYLLWSMTTSDGRKVTNE